MLILRVYVVACGQDLAKRVLSPDSRRSNPRRRRELGWEGLPASQVDYNSELLCSGCTFSVESVLVPRAALGRISYTGNSFCHEDTARKNAVQRTPKGERLPTIQQAGAAHRLAKKSTAEKATKRKSDECRTRHVCQIPSVSTRNLDHILWDLCSSLEKHASVDAQAKTARARTR